MYRKALSSPPPKQNTCIVRFLAFTLVEVLITLGIIGIVAAVTMPTLIANHQKTVTINKLKSEYSKFADVITRSVNDNGNVLDWIAEYNSTDSAERTKLIPEKYILPYIEGGGKTFRQYVYGDIWSLGGKETLFSYYCSGAPYRIKNGTVFKISVYNNRLILLLDIDNKINPNRIGKDVFAFEINTTNNQLVPAGSGLSRKILTGDDKDRWCKPPECATIEWLTGWKSCKKGNLDRYSGYYCTALIVQDGWQMTDDYPW